MKRRKRLPEVGDVWGRTYWLTSGGTDHKREDRVVVIEPPRGYADGEIRVRIVSVPWGGRPMRSSPKLYTFWAKYHLVSPNTRSPR